LGGREVLDRIKTDPHLRAIPVVILTTSQSQKDIAECYESQASCYLVKPLDFDCFTAMLQQIEDFWFSIACLPRQV
ncbi:MAG: response regulator, partial [Sumerlaeia bacterium]